MPVKPIQLHYLLPAFALLVLEVLIALCVHDQVIRPFGGDFLVVISLYCLVRGVTNLRVLAAVGSVLLFAYIIEICQYFQLIHVLNLQDNIVARLILGTHFSWIDMLAYTAGIAFILFIDFPKKTIRKWNTL